MTAINTQIATPLQSLADLKETRSTESTKLERPIAKEHCGIKLCKPKKCESKYFDHLQTQFDKLQEKAGYLKDHGHCMSKGKLAKHLKEMRQLAKSVRWTIKQLPCKMQNKFSSITETCNDIAGKLHGVNKCNARSKFSCVKHALCDALDLKRPTCRKTLTPWQPPVFPGQLRKA